MDKKRKIKAVAAVCFVILCGALYLVFARPFKGADGDVFELHSKTVQSEAGTKEGGNSVPLQETTNGGDSESHPEDKAESGENGNALYVHICGAVLEEGVYALPVGSRVTDGIAAAGGFSEGADTSFHNLAALLGDGQKIYVPTMEETASLSFAERNETVENPLAQTEGAYASATGKKINLNTAGLAELMTLSGIGESKAESILKYREKVGRFQSIEELKKVSGIGDAMFERIQEQIVVE